MTVEQPGPQLGDSLFGEERLRPVGAHAVLAVVAVVATTLVNAYQAYAVWDLRQMFDDLVAGRIVSAELLHAINDFDSLRLPLFGLSVLMGLLFMLWLWRARVNAELLGGPDSQSKSRGWTIGGWLIPVVNLWVPYQVVRDIWLGSSRQPLGSARLVLGWWLVFVAKYLGGLVVFVLVRRQKVDDIDDADSLLSLLTTYAVAELVVTVTAAVMVIMIVRRITAWQTDQ